MRDENPTRRGHGTAEVSINGHLISEQQVRNRIDASFLDNRATPRSPIARPSLVKSHSPPYHWSPPTHLFDIESLGQLIFEKIQNDRAKIVVLVPLYNYENFISECLGSVVSQDLDDLSLVVIDDCSRDSSCDAALEFIIKHADRFSAARLVRHKRNQGPAMARNTGVVWSTEPLLFPLDADNRIRPPALSRLLEAVLCSEAQFAYSQLSFFGARNGLGVADIWSLRRLLRETYIDMMALIKREALIAAGGVFPLADDIGWEDHDLWCRFAELGFRGVFLPELLCEYRVHASARTRATDSVVDHLTAEIELRHPTLFNCCEVGEQRRPFDVRHLHEAETSVRVVDKREDGAPGDDARAVGDVRTGNLLSEAKEGLRFRRSLRVHPNWRELAPLLGEFFDPVWYRSKYPDLDAEGIDLFSHFVDHGAQELRDPCGEFQSSFYLAQYPDVEKSGEIPVVHYLLRGREEARSPKIYHIQDFGIDSGYQLASSIAGSSRKVCVLFHLYHVDLFSELADYIDNVQVEKDVFVNLVDETWTPELHQTIYLRMPAARVIISPDYGRDIGGFTRLLSAVDFNQYDLFLFVHSKKSPHLLERQGRFWRRTLLDAIVGSPSIATARVEGMRLVPNIGIVGAKRWRDFSMYSNNRKYQELLDMASISSTARDCEFVAGTMFFIRTDVVKRLYGVTRKLSFEDGHKGDLKYHMDGQYAHSIERLIGNLVRDEGFCFWWV